MPDQTPLDASEIADVQRLFGSPFFIPSSFKTWMADQLALNIPDLPLNSLFGGRGITRSLEATTAVSAASANGSTGIIFSKVIQGGTLGANGRIRFMVEGRVIQASGSQSWECDLVFGGTTLCTVTDVSGTNRNIILEGEIYNANNPSVQYASIIRLRLTDGLSVDNVNVQTDNGESAIDTRVDQTLVIQIRYTGGVNANDHWDRTYVNVDVVNPVPLGAAT